MKKIKHNIMKFFLDYHAKPIDSKKVNTAVVFAPRQLGDVMSILPVVRSLQKSGVPNIVFVGKNYSKNIVLPLKLEGIDVYIIPHERCYFSVACTAKKIAKKYGEVDVCIQCMQRDITGSILFQAFLKAGSNIGGHLSEWNFHCNEYCKKANELRINNIPPPVFWVSLMESAGFETVRKNYELPFCKENNKDNKKLIEIYNKYGSFVLINLDGSVEKRRINIVVAKKILQEIWSIFGLKVAITCAPSGKEKADKLADDLDFVFVPCLEKTIENAAFLVKASVLVVSPDTSIIHIASALDKPIVGIYSGDNAQWHPLSSIKEVVKLEGNINNVNVYKIREALQKLKPKIIEESDCIQGDQYESSCSSGMGSRQAAFRRRN